MPNNNQNEEVERIVEQFIRDFTEPHPEGRTMYGRHTQPTERLIEVYRQTLTTHGASEYARGKREERERIKLLFPALNPNSTSWGTSEMERILKQIDSLNETDNN